MAPYIKILDPDTFALLGIIDEYASLSTTVRSREPGEWTLTLPADEHTLALLRLGNLIILPAFSGLVRRIELSQDDSGTDTLTVSGCDLGGLMADRLALPASGGDYATYTGTPGEVMSAIVRDNCISPGDAARIYSHFSIGNVDNSGEQMTYLARYETVADALFDIAQANGLTWHVSFASGGYELSIERCVDRSTSQAQRPPVIFSPEYDNVSGQSYVSDAGRASSCALVAGRGQGAARELAWIGAEASGYARRERYITVNKYDDLAAAGAQALGKYAPLQSFDGSILSSDTYVYGVHWAVGDIVTVRRLSWGVSMDVEVAEVTCVYEGVTQRLEVTFGDSRLTLIDVIRRAIRPLEDEGRT